MLIRPPQTSWLTDIVSETFDGIWQEDLRSLIPYACAWGQIIEIPHIYKLKVAMAVKGGVPSLGSCLVEVLDEGTREAESCTVFGFSKVVEQWEPCISRGRLWGEPWSMREENGRYGSIGSNPLWRCLDPLVEWLWKKTMPQQVHRMLIEATVKPAQKWVGKSHPLA